jgi:hypothetical protein
MANFKSTLEIYIRVKSTSVLPGQDTTTDRLKIGASLRNGSPLSGLSFEEEVKYLPSIINVSPKDVEFRRIVREYWNDISVIIDPDGLNPDPKKQGKELKFTVLFTEAELKAEFDKAKTFEEKAVVLARIEAETPEKVNISEGVGDFILFKYCLVYNKVANSYKDAYKSASITFYLYSREIEVKASHTLLQLEMQANAKFINIFKDISKINTLLRMFKQTPEEFDTLEDKHIALSGFVKARPKDFLAYVNDADLDIKAIILTAANKGIIYNPDNTESYYFGANKEVTLGTSLIDAVLYLKQDTPKNKEIRIAIEAKIKES